MRILHVTPWYEPAWSSGGTAVSVSNICRGLVKLGADVCVLTTTDKGAGEVLSKQSFSDDLGGVKIYYSACGLPGISVRQGALSIDLCKNIVKMVPKFDLVHVHSTRHIYGVVAALTCVRAKVPYVITPHGSLMPWWIESIGSPFLKKMFIKLIDRFVLSSARSLHFLSEFEKISSSKWAFNSDSFVLPNGVKKQKETSVNCQKKQKLKLLHVGRIHPQKNTLELVKAVSQLSPEDVTLDIVGAVDDQSLYDACCDFLTTSNVTHIRFLGAKSLEDVHEAYKNYDLFCMPSVVEGVSMALIEASSFGLPALVSEFVGNHREIISDDSGVLTELNAKSIAAAITSIKNDPQKLEMLKLNALKSIDKRYDIDLVVVSLQNIYKEILKNS